MADIQSPTAEIKRGKKRKKVRRRKKKPQAKNIMVCLIPQGDHKKPVPTKLLKNYLVDFTRSNIYNDLHLKPILIAYGN